MSTFDSTPMAITARALAHNFNLEERSRREQAQLNKEFYYDRQEQSLMLMNDDVDPVTMNITKPILNKRCGMLYRRPLVREFLGNAQSIAFLEQVYLENSVDTLLGKVDLMSELTGSALVHPALDEEYSTGIRLAIFDGAQFSAVPTEEDQTRADAISLIKMVDRLVDDPHVYVDPKSPQLERKLYQQIWTKKSVTLYEGDIMISTEENELGFIPFVNFMGEEVPDQFVGYPTASLVRKANHHINQLLTHLAFTIKMQAGTPIIFSGFKSGESVVIHPGRAINIPNDTAASTLALNPKITDTLNTIQWLEDRLYTCSSVPRISVEGGEGTSGRELMIRWWPLLQVFQEKTVRFSRYELNLANTILAVAGMEPIEDVKVHWPEESILPFSANEETLDRDIAFNISTPLDEIMRRDPELDEGAAMAEFIKNTQVNQLLQSASNEEETEENEQ